MNRIAKCLCMVAVIALTFTACKKKDDNTEMLQFNGTIQQMEVVDEEFDGRMYLDPSSYKLKFEAGDLISIFNAPNTDGTGLQRAIYEVQPTTLAWQKVSGTIDDDGIYYAYYPGGEDCVHIDSVPYENRVRFTLGPTQDYRTLNGKVLVPEKALYGAAKATQTSLTSTRFSFKNMCGILSMRLFNPMGAGDENMNVTSIVLTDNSYNIVGNVTLKIHEVNATEMQTMFNQYNPNNASYMNRLSEYMARIGYDVTPSTEAPVTKTLTLNCVTADQYPNGVELGTTAAKATEFYFVLRPLALRNGCHMIVHFKGGTTADISSPATHTICPNQVKRMNPINVMTYHP